MVLIHSANESDVACEARVRIGKVALLAEHSGGSHWWLIPAIRKLPSDPPSAV